jgi:hypothetical protein
MKKIDYSKTVIYKIVCNDILITDIYIGSTTNFVKRKCAHKNRINDPKHSHYKIYTTIRDNGGWENWQMIEIEKYPCADGNESRARERYWFEELQAKLNTNTPFREQGEYMKEYKEKNKEHIKEQTKEYREQNREKVLQRYKDYDLANKEKRSIASKERYHKNIDKIKEANRQTIFCECCNKNITKIYKNRHEKTQGHIDNAKNNIDI